MSEHPIGRVAGWILLACVGLALAVVLSVTASNLSTQPIGLSGEPLRAGERLAPPAVTRTDTRTGPGRHKPTPTTPTQTAPATQTTPSTSGSGSSAPGDDKGGRRDHDSDDD